MLVTRILGDCPGCKKPNAYGNVDVFGKVLIRGCGFCKYEEKVHLPDITKSILYLDQFFFSTAFRQGDERFVDAAKRIGETAHLQLLTAPYSSLHEEETEMWKNRDELREFIRKTSRGARFAPQYYIEKTQVLKAFNAWLKKESAEYVIEERDAFFKDVHRWDSYFTIGVRGYRHDPEELRESKQKSVDGLVGIFDDWRKDTTTFDQDVEEELQAAARGYVRAYSELVTRVGQGDFSALLFSSVRSEVVEVMMDMIGRKTDPEVALRMCGDFFRSDHFRNTPFHWLSARIYAVLKDMVRRGAFKNAAEAKDRLKGFFYDVNHIATYAPYSDALVIDAFMAELVSHPNIDLENKYYVDVFSRRNWDDLLKWIEDLKAEMTPERQAALDAIHAKKK